MPHLRRWLLVGVLMMVAGAFYAPAASSDPAPPPKPQVTALAGPGDRADINGDGIPDIVVSTGARKTFPGDPNLPPNDTGGSVYVQISGGVPAQLIQQNTADPPVPGSSEADDQFGQTIATADFNGDNLADVAIGNPKESLGSRLSAGTVTVLYGRTTSPYLGFPPNSLSNIHQDITGVPADAEAGDLFGQALATGDFNADGFADLAISAPGEAIGTLAKAGAVFVFYGSASGISTTGISDFNQDTAGVPGVPETDDRFGWGLAAGDVTGDGKDDLAISAAGEAVTGAPSGSWGGVQLLPGSTSGVTTTGQSFFDVTTGLTQGHYRHLAIGRFHGGANAANADVVVYADQRLNAPQNSGALIVARGGSDGVNTSRLQVINQATAGINGTPEANDYYGGSLAGGDFDGDGNEDLAVGMIGEDSATGYVGVYLGGASGLLSSVEAVIHEDDPLIGATKAIHEGFGYSTRVLDIDGDGKPELLISAPWEDGSLQSGVLFVLDLARNAQSIAVTGSQQITRGTLGAISNYGPGVPIADGSTLLEDSTDEPGSGARPQRQARR